MEQHVAVSEDLVEKLTPTKDVGENEVDERNKILEGIAEVCMQQRQYHLATKKYTQAGNRVKVCDLKKMEYKSVSHFVAKNRRPVAPYNASRLILPTALKRPYYILF